MDQEALAPIIIDRIRCTQLRIYHRLNRPPLPNNQLQNMLSNIERANFKDSIIIHVIDDSKNEKRDFHILTLSPLKVHEVL